MPIEQRVVEERHFEMKEWEQPKPAAHFKHVLYALASRQPGWLYASDRKGSREAAARAFERLLGLPPRQLSTFPVDPLEEVASEANREAEKLGTTEDRLHYLAPYDDDCVFLRTPPGLLDALLAAKLVAPENGPTEALAPGPPTLKESDPLMSIAAFSNDAQNLFENMGLQTVGDLMGSSVKRLAQACRDGDLVWHIQVVLKRAGLRLRRR